MKIVERHSYDGSKITKTRRLVFEPYSCDISKVIQLIQQNITPDLLKRKKLLYKDPSNKYYGHCYHASQALYYLMDMDSLVPMSGEDYREEKHWWLRCDDTIYDCTADQYYSVGQEPPYNKGKKSKWYGWKERPQQISLELMIRVLGDRLIEDRVDKY